MNPYIFIHINKCGGTSIKSVLGQNKYQYHKHERISSVKDRMRKDTFDNAFKFAVIRHPYSRIQSMYHYRKRKLRRFDLPFQEWFYQAFEGNLTLVPMMNEPCWNWISIDGKLTVDYVARLEMIEADWKHICGALGINKPLPKLNSLNYKKEPFTDDMKRIVEDKFSKDFELYERSVSA